MQQRRLLACAFLGSALALTGCGDDDAGEVGFNLMDLAHQLKAVDTGHLDVAQNQVDRMRGHDAHRFGGISRH